MNGTETTRSAIMPCSPGNYCTNGIQIPCPAGRYSENGSPSSLCDGFCSAGYYCLEGSVSPRQHSCPPGVYGDEGMVDSYCLGIYIHIQNT